MQQLDLLLRTLPDDIGDHVDEPPELRDLSDAALVQGVANAIARPKQTKFNSFIIHAPLELLARAQLLRRAPAAARSRIRLRIAAIAAVYADGEEVEAPVTWFASAEVAGDALTQALREADPDQADAAMCMLAATLPLEVLVRRLADVVVGQLGLAAHAPILLSALPEAEKRWGPLAQLLRAPIYALARDGRERLDWIDAPADDDRTDATDDLFQALAHPERVQSPSLFIAPTLLSVEAGGYAARTLSRATASLTVAEARRCLSRIAALAMLQDDPDHAPYGWTHCLSMPQGVLALAAYGQDPRRFVRVAATHALGFRATLGKSALELAWPSVADPDIASLIAEAGAHPDAHLAKYTLACLIAADQDPEASSLYLAAATRLAAWWVENPDAAIAA